jgi:hypothetical protein
MDLQYALLLIGVLIVGGVALSAYDKLRFDWGRRTDATGLALKRRRAGQDDAGETTTLRPLFRGSGLDRNPPPPNTDPEQKHLRTDAPVGPLSERDTEYYLYEELESLENAAHMPLNLNLGLSDPEEAPSEDPQARRTMPDEKIDFVVTLPGKGPIGRDRALGVYKQNEYMLEKPRSLYGLGHKTGLWSNLDSDPEFARYSSIALALQLADNRGPVSESELNTFVQLSLKLADELQRPTKLSMPIEDALERARELDSFCAANDVLASVNIVSNNAAGFGGRAIGQAATALGMQFGKMNIYHMKNDNAAGCRHLFSLANLYAPGEFTPETMNTLTTRGLTLFMSVPCAYQPVRVFEKMIETANGLCQALDGSLQDSEKQPLTAQGLAVIRAQIERIATDMQVRGIVPGSETAMRLF